MEALGIYIYMPVAGEDGQLTYYMSQQLGNEVERQGKARQSTTPRTALSFFIQRKEEELPLVGFEPTTLCSLGERSTN